MNFTREPIIETIISPREGNKLLVRNSKSGNAEEYYVDAVEVVSFGHAFFYRSLERPKAFILPVGDYEILEVKETRVALKHSSHERSIKIGGGKEASMRQAPREQAPAKEQESVVAEEAQPVGEESVLEAAIGSRMDKRRDRRRHRRRRGGEEQEWTARKPAEGEESSASEGQPAMQGGGMDDETKVSSPMFSALIPPPTTLISETIGRYKEKEQAEEHKSEVEKEKRESTKKNPPEEQGDSNSEPSVLSRVSVGAPPAIGGDFFI